MEKIWNHLNEGMLLVDTQNIICFCNTSLAKKIPKGELIGQSLDKCFENNKEESYFLYEDKRNKKILFNYVQEEVTWKGQTYCAYLLKCYNNQIGRAHV